MLELGTHAEFVPRDRFTIRSFAAEEFPNVVADGDVRCSQCSRSGAFGRRQRFFTRILPPVGETNPRPIYSRHYCDVAMLAQGQIRADALADRDLLAQVVRHKETFYPSGWARYDLAGPGSLRLVPVETRVAALERDYRNMGAMIFGDAPKFDWIMEALKALEREINR
ncbi:MAG TPA: nucleotidyl transferase AbiEii/AbiGii toxin family protein [Candidatus Acidoferrales bacterium]|nr:nucleotidyl transferase AbiEii/AbiGii toxin family protein [Candidatus Acidoferrales bacterium]